MPLKTQQEQSPELNLTPMIDIVFLLIIFFMVGTKFAEMERSVDLNVPQAAGLGKLSSPDARVIVNVYPDGSIYLDSQPVTIDQLTQTLEQRCERSPELGVVVRGEASGALQNVASVLTACRAAGVRTMGLAVKPEHAAKDRR